MGRIWVITTEQQSISAILSDSDMEKPYTPTLQKFKQTEKRVIYKATLHYLGVNQS